MAPRKRCSRVLFANSPERDDEREDDHSNNGADLDSGEDDRRDQEPPRKAARSSGGLLIPRRRGSPRHRRGQAGPGGTKLDAPRLRRSLQWVEAAITRTGTIVNAFAECKDRAGMPKEKAVREHIELLIAKSKDLDTVVLGFMEAILCQWDTTVH